ASEYFPAQQQGAFSAWEQTSAMKTTRRLVVAGLGSSMLVPIVAGEALGQTQSRADRGFATLAHRWLDETMRQGPVNATLIGDHRFDAQLDDVGANGRNAVLRFAHETLNALNAIDKTQLSRANQVDAALLDNALRSQIWTVEVSQDHAWNVINYQTTAGGA